MNHDDDLNLARRLQLGDIDALGDGQKGRGTGRLTDYEIALSFMRDDIAAALIQSDDRRLALRDMESDFDDENVLRFIRNGEYLAALTVIGSKDNDLATPEADSEESKSSEGLDSGSTITRSRRSCDSCYEYFDTLPCTTPCEHRFCHDCARQLILGAIKEEMLYPPRCCNHVISHEVITSVLSDEELQEFSNKSVEYESKLRLYCAEPSCSSFIGSTNIKDEHGTCTKCHRRTHILCRSLAHPKEVDCPKDTGIQQLLKTAEEKHWRRCSECRRVVELVQGCNHIYCLSSCGYEFCYLCGLKWRTCVCQVWDEGRLMNRRHAERANRAIRPRAGYGARRVALPPLPPPAALAAAVENLPASRIARLIRPVVPVAPVENDDRSRRGLYGLLSGRTRR
ncbi:hypothetical protein N7456_001900 [Penicillium angulare]|uniref:RBR-type E3 ubiquitin transferase n=1 Tax=Penicillium angulare TaxID=116970 RepID=A0A9W9G762_9EURO|nr:hypothetical protein N7456_001900 [Penicillium angulare]